MAKKFLNIDTKKDLPPILGAGAGFIVGVKFTENEYFPQMSENPETQQQIEMGGKILIGLIGYARMKKPAAKMFFAGFAGSGLVDAYQWYQARQLLTEDEVETGRHFINYQQPTQMSAGKIGDATNPYNVD